MEEVTNTVTDIATTASTDAINYGTIGVFAMIIIGILVTFFKKNKSAARKEEAKTDKESANKIITINNELQEKAKENIDNINTKIKENETKTETLIAKCSEELKADIEAANSENSVLKETVIKKAISEIKDSSLWSTK